MYTIFDWKERVFPRNYKHKSSAIRAAKKLARKMKSGVVVCYWEDSPAVNFKTICFVKKNGKVVQDPFPTKKEE